MGLKECPRLRECPYRAHSCRVRELISVWQNSQSDASVTHPSVYGYYLPSREYENSMMNDGSSPHPIHHGDTGPPKLVPTFSLPRDLTLSIMAYLT